MPGGAAAALKRRGFVGLLAAGWLGLWGGGAAAEPIVVTTAEFGAEGGLEEALQAVQHGGGTITFAPELAGAVIDGEGTRFNLVNGALRIEGLVNELGEPNVTLRRLRFTAFQQSFHFSNLVFADNPYPGGAGVSPNVRYGTQVGSFFRGGAIENGNGTLHVENCDFINNAAGEDGGAIFNSGVMYVVDSRFIGNQAGNVEVEGRGEYKEGGAIFNWTPGYAVIERSTISGNTAWGRGGGIFNAGGEIQVIDSIISDNMVVGYDFWFNAGGGGIYNAQGRGHSGVLFYGEMEIIGSTISGNRGDYGGGIVNSNVKLRIVDSTIADNETASRPCPECEFVNGGAGIVNTHRYGGPVPEMTLIDSTVTGNRTLGEPLPDESGFGFADAGSGGGIVNAGHLEIVGSTISDNHTNVFGGGIHLRQNPGHAAPTLHVRGDSTIADNSAESGGGIYNAAGVATLEGAAIRGNWTAGNWGVLGEGGGIVNNDTLHLVGSTIEGNTATQAGGGIANRDRWRRGDVVLTVTDSIIRDNRAEGQVPAGSVGRGGGGGLHNGPRDHPSDDPGDWSGEITLRGTLIEGNHAPFGPGGGMALEGALVELEASTVRDNRADVRGGGIAMTFGALDIATSSISGNEAPRGGGIDAQGSFESLVVAQSAITGNLATSAQGAIRAGGGGLASFVGRGLVIENSTISGNDSAAHGGGLYVAHSSELTLRSSTVTDNTAATEGGGLANRDATAVLEGTIIAGNSAGSGGDCSGRPAPPPPDFPEPFPDGIFTSLGYNLDGDGSCELAAATDLPGTDPLLALLGDNGGPTLTHALQDGSPAIDAIPEIHCAVAVDQRGVARPQGEGCDIGAFEAPHAQVPVTAIAATLEFFDDAVDSGDLVGTGQGPAAQGRLGAFGNQLRAVEAYLEQGEIALACAQLESAAKLSNGTSPPPDLVEGEAAAELNAQIEALREELDCATAVQTAAAG